jgi:hypothetical protein
MALATVAVVGIGKPQASDETDDEDQPRERTRVSQGERVDCEERRHGAVRGDF